MSTKERFLSQPIPGALRRPSPGQLVRLAVRFYAAMAAVAWLWRGWFRGASLWRASPEASIDWVRDPLLGAAAAAAVVFVSALFTRHTRAGRDLARTLGALIGRLRARDCVVLAALSGVGEELLFRGALQPEIGLVPASVVFAFAHFSPRRELRVWTLFTLAAGLLLGALYDATGNLVAPIVAHFGVNAVNLHRLSREWGDAEPPSAAR